MQIDEQTDRQRACGGEKGKEKEKERRERES